MSKLRNSRPDTLQRSSPSCRLPGCCSAAVMPWLPPACLVGVRVMQELVSIDWIKDSENPNIQTGRSQNCQYLQNGLSRDSTSSRQWMNFWLRQLCRRWGTTTGTCAARWCCLPSSPDWSPTRRSTTWPRNSSTSRRPRCPWQAHFFRKEFTVFF